MAETGLTGQVNSWNSYRDDYNPARHLRAAAEAAHKERGHEGCFRKGQAVPLGSSLPCLKGRLLGTSCIYK